MRTEHFLPFFPEWDGHRPLTTGAEDNQLVSPVGAGFGNRGRLGLGHQLRSQSITARGAREERDGSGDRNDGNEKKGKKIPYFHLLEVTKIITTRATAAKTLFPGFLNRAEAKDKKHDDASIHINFSSDLFVIGFKNPAPDQG
jgi:hypothetical protein